MKNNDFQPSNAISLILQGKPLHSQDITNQNITSLILPNTEHKDPSQKGVFFSNRYTLGSSKDHNLLSLNDL